MPGHRLSQGAGIAPIGFEPEGLFVSSLGLQPQIIEIKRRRKSSNE
jgi:hypothetical protein